MPAPQGHPCRGRVCASAALTASAMAITSCPCCKLEGRPVKPEGCGGGPQWTDCPAGHREEALAPHCDWPQFWLSDPQESSTAHRSPHQPPSGLQRELSPAPQSSSSQWPKRGRGGPGRAV